MTFKRHPGADMPEPHAPGSLSTLETTNTVTTAAAKAAVNALDFSSPLASTTGRVGYTTFLNGVASDRNARESAQSTEVSDLNQRLDTLKSTLEAKEDDSPLPKVVDKAATGAR